MAKKGQTYILQDGHEVRRADVARGPSSTHNIQLLLDMTRPGILLLPVDPWRGPPLASTYLTVPFVS